MKRALPTFVDCFDSLDVVLLTASVPIRAFRYLTGRHIAQANVAVGRLSVAGHVWCLSSSVYDWCIPDTQFRKSASIYFSKKHASEKHGFREGETSLSGSEKIEADFLGGV